jgi:uncharacterized membrane protein YhaH (DUF805 family)
MLSNYITVMQKYFAFNGRATRSEYWYFLLMNVTILISLSVLNAIVIEIQYVLIAYNLFIVIPSISVGARRLHDIGKSGWWLLIGLIPFLGLILFYFFIKDSATDNEYGPNPKN